MTVASRKGVINTACGLPKAMHSSNKPKHIAPGGMRLVL
jgi:hypothetical protein